MRLFPWFLCHPLLDEIILNLGPWETICSYLIDVREIFSQLANLGTRENFCSELIWSKIVFCRWWIRRVEEESRMSWLGGLNFVGELILGFCCTDHPNFTHTFDASNNSLLPFTLEGVSKNKHSWVCVIGGFLYVRANRRVLCFAEQPVKWSRCCASGTWSKTCKNQRYVRT